MATSLIFHRALCSALHSMAKQLTKRVSILTRQRRDATIGRDVVNCGPGKTERMDLGLAILSCVGKPGVSYTYDEIAAWAGCSNSAIYRIEREALKKLRKRAKFLKDPVLAELAHEFFRRE